MAQDFVDLGIVGENVERLLQGLIGAGKFRGATGCGEVSFFENSNLP